MTKIRGNTDKNLGPKSSSYDNFSVCHLNLSSNPGHNFMKLSFVHFHS